ncbi:MAG: hypothetical protein JNJ83_08310 [Verrucomicrobiaceae bacterium]|nr:hypothetical protein [Verrucomicrobiaceae bacterium]
MKMFPVIFTLLVVSGVTSVLQAQEKHFWSLDPTKLRIPDTPLSGHLHGCPDFKPDLSRLFMASESLTFSNYGTSRSGHNITIRHRILTPTPELENLKFTQPPSENETSFNVPQSSVDVSSDTIVGGRGHYSSTESFRNNFAMVLEFGTIKDGKLPGGIYICLPDPDKSVIAGRFELIAPQLDLIKGTLSLPPVINEAALYLGWLASYPPGSPFTDGCEIPVGKGGAVGSYQTMSGSAQNRLPLCRITLTQQHRDGEFRLQECKPGWHLLFLAAGTYERAERDPQKPAFFPAGNSKVYGRGDFNLVPEPRLYAATWIEVKAANSKNHHPIKLDPAELGIVKVRVPNARDGSYVSFLPLNHEGILPLPDIHAVSPFLRLRVKNSMADPLSLLAGSYEFSCLGIKRTVQVTKGTTTTVTLVRE